MSFECECKELYDAMLRLRLLAAVRKARAGLRYSATTEFQDYPEGCVEVGTCLDAIDMIVKDVLRFIAESDDEFSPYREQLVLKKG